MILEINNFTKALEGTCFDKWNLFEIDENPTTYSFKARNKPHSKKHTLDCIAVLIEIQRHENEHGTYRVTMAYESYGNQIYTGFLTKKEIGNKVGFFRLLTEAIEKHENK